MSDNNPSSDPVGLSPTSNTSAPPPVTSSAPPSDVPMDDDADRLLNAETLEQEGDGEELVGDGMQRDYRAIPELDRYDTQGIDDAEHEDVLDPFEARRLAERDLEERDRLAGRERVRVPRMLLSSEGDDGSDDGRALRGRGRRRRAEAAAAGAGVGAMATGEFDEEFDMDDVEYDEKKGPFRDWIAHEGPRRYVERSFFEFLHTYQDDKGNLVYQERIRRMCSENKESLFVSWGHLVNSSKSFLIWIADHPTEILPILDQVAMEVVLSYFPNYRSIKSEIHVRITDLILEDSLRQLRHIHLNAMVKVSGVVTRRTGVFPQLKYVKYNCDKCGALMGPYFQSATGKINIGSCPECASTGPFTVNSAQTVYRNYQKITLQETPGTVPPGRLPRYKEVILLWDLIDCARPGDEIEVTGIYRNNFDVSLNAQHGFPIFSTILEANYVAKKDDQYAAVHLTDEDTRRIREMGQDERIGEKIISSIAPSIYGHRDIKTAIALAMFGAETKVVQDHRVRGDINILLMGDPGTAKSQFLKYVEKTAHRAVFTTGQGASAVGLTAAVRRDPVTSEWTLEGGALVLADRGLCLIDEFDKMNDKDRVSIHEAMEQQSISISKAGIVTTLQARCSIIAAANPIGGRYDPAKPFNENVDLTEPILSRFDVLTVVRDEVNPVLDERLAAFIVGSHRRNHPDVIQMIHEEGGADVTPTPAMHEIVEAVNAARAAGGSGTSIGTATGALIGANENSDEIIGQEMLRKYITWAKMNVKPQSSNIDHEKIISVYSTLRAESETSTGLPMSIRHLESIVRMAEAHARMHLREFVREDDINVAIRIVLDSFIGAQKFSVMKALRQKFHKFVSYKKDHNELLSYTLQNLVRDTVNYYQIKHPDRTLDEAIEIDMEEFEAKARELGIHDLHPFFESQLFASNGFSLGPNQRTIIKRFR